MGRRGIGSKPKPKQPAPAAPLLASEPHAWDAPRLSRAERVIRFVESLPCTAGKFAGTNLKLRPFQKKFIRDVYRTDKQGNRLIRTAVLSVARKNGKTQLAAALCLAHLSGPEAEPRGECYSVACTRFQAGRVFAEMVAIITRTPWLDDRINIIRFRKELEDTVNGSTYDVLSADVAPVHGLSPSFVIYDELGQIQSRDVFDALSTALGGRENPLMLVISTQAASDTAPMSELVDYGLRVNRNEVVDASFHLTLFTASKDADLWSPRTWRKANPALDDFRSLQDVERLARQAQRMPTAEASFRQLILNQRVSTIATFIGAEAWKLCGGAVDIDRLRGRPCFAGLDLGGAQALTALTLAFADDDGGYDIMVYAWLPGETLQQREDADKAPYTLWAQQGHLLTFPGRSNDPQTVATKIAELHGIYGFKELAFDAWRIEDLKRELAIAGCEAPLVGFGQGWKSMGPACDAFEKLVLDQKIRHGMNPVLTSAVSNAKAEIDSAGNRKLSRVKSSGRIDAAVALVMALGTASRHQAMPEWVPLLQVV